MKFIQNRMPSGAPDLSRWTSEGGNFAIQRYTYEQKWGLKYRSKTWTKCEPYYGAYRLCDGEVLLAPKARGTYGQAVKACENHSWKGEN